MRRHEVGGQKCDKMSENEDVHARHIFAHMVHQFKKNLIAEGTNVCVLETHPSDNLNTIEM